jgi:hypothetical protein
LADSPNDILGGIDGDWIALAGDKQIWGLAMNPAYRRRSDVMPERLQEIAGSGQFTFGRFDGRFAGATVMGVVGMAAYQDALLTAPGQRIQAEF